jgi:hypothetical protein
VKRILTIAFVVVIIVVAAYIIFSQYELVKRKPREGVSKPKPGVSETKESAALKKREEIYRSAASGVTLPHTEILLTPGLGARFPAILLPEYPVTRFSQTCYRICC